MSGGTSAGVVFGVDDVLRGLRFARDARGPDYVYQNPDPDPDAGPRFVYTARIDGELSPACIVGYALHHLGVPLECLSHPALNDARVPRLTSYLAERGYRLTVAAHLVLGAAQNVQDDRVTWGEAVAAAENEDKRQRWLEPFTTTGLDDQVAEAVYPWCFIARQVVGHLPDCAERRQVLWVLGTGKYRAETEAQGVTVTGEQSIAELRNP